MAAPADRGLQPQPMGNWSSFFYFIAFVIVVSYTLLNLYIGRHAANSQAWLAPEMVHALLAAKVGSLSINFGAGCWTTRCSVGLCSQAPRAPAGVLCSQFSRIRQQSQTGSAFLTDQQTEWAELSKMVFRLKPPEKSPVPRNKTRR